MAKMVYLPYTTLNSPICAYGYDRASGILYLQFWKRHPQPKLSKPRLPDTYGDTWQYPGVPLATAKDFHFSKAKGKFFQEKLAGKLGSSKLKSLEAAGQESLFGPAEDPGENYYGTD